MGKGLSPLQNQLLGLACAVNAHTQGGRLAVKTGRPLDGYRVPTIDYCGPKDLHHRVAMWGVGGFLPDAGVPGGFFAHTRDYLTIKASITRATSRLLSRGLIVFAPNKDANSNWGYLLTAEGLRLGAPHQCEVPHLDLALRVFWIINPGYPRFQDTRDVDKRRALIRHLRDAANGYRHNRPETKVTDTAERLPTSCDATPIADTPNGYFLPSSGKAITDNAEARP